jgi:hypothetical protein
MREAELWDYRDRVKFLRAERDLYRTALETATRRGEAPTEEPPEPLRLEEMDDRQLTGALTLAGWGASQMLPRCGIRAADFCLVIFNDPDHPQCAGNSDRARTIAALRHVVEHLGLAIANGQKPTLRLAGGLTF